MTELFPQSSFGLTRFNHRLAKACTVVITSREDSVVKLFSIWLVRVPNERKKTAAKLAKERFSSGRQPKHPVTRTDADLRQLLRYRRRKSNTSRSEVINVVHGLATITEKVKTGEEGKNKLSSKNRFSIAESRRPLRSCRWTEMYRYAGICRRRSWRAGWLK